MKKISKQIEEFEAVRKKRKKGQCNFMKKIIDSVVDEVVEKQKRLITVKNQN